MEPLLLTGVVKCNTFLQRYFRRPKIMIMPRCNAAAYNYAELWDNNTQRSKGRKHGSFDLVSVGIGAERLKPPNRDISLDSGTASLHVYPVRSIKRAYCALPASLGSSHSLPRNEW